MRCRGTWAGSVLQETRRVAHPEIVGSSPALPSRGAYAPSSLLPPLDFPWQARRGFEPWPRRVIPSEQLGVSAASHWGPGAGLFSLYLPAGARAVPRRRLVRSQPPPVLSLGQHHTGLDRQGRAWASAWPRRNPQISAGVGQWQSASFPSWTRGFDPRHRLQGACPAQYIKNPCERSAAICRQKIKPSAP